MVTGRSLRVWGKTIDIGGSRDPQYHPLLYHMIDAGNVARLILESADATHLLRRFQSLAGATKTTVLSLVPFLVSLHDVGKASPSFQRKSKALWLSLVSPELPDSPSVLSDFDHSRESQCALDSLLPAPLRDNGDYRPLRRGLAQALGSHHGRFHKASDLRGYPEISSGSVEPYEQAWNAVRAELAAGLQGIFLSDLDGSPRLCPANLSALCMLLSGFTILCDWLASDSEAFPPNSTSDYRAYALTSRELARGAVHARGLLGFLPDSVEPRYTTLFPDRVPPRPLQRSIESSRLPDLPEQALYIIEAPTGEGKTEAALLIAARVAHLASARGFYFALPTVATSNQMFDRVVSYLAQQAPPGAPASAILVNGQSHLSERMDVLRRTSPLGGADEGGAWVELDSWFLPRKRSLLAPYGVGTIDQAMLAGLNIRHGSLRMLGLAGKVLVVDEIHAYDLYMTTIIGRLLSWLKELGASVILLSATLPSAKKAELVRAYSGESQPVGESCRDSAYPLVTIVPAEGPRAAVRLLSPEGTAMQRSVTIERWLGGESDRLDAADYLLSSLSGGGGACWICNTVVEAQACYRAVEAACMERLVDERPDVILFHARFPLGKRREIEGRVLSRFGPDANRSRPTILIATQVVEQSLDLDFDLMMSYLAPVDLLLQRVGRLHRFQGRIDRPESLRKPRLVLLMPRLGENGPDFGRDRFVYHPFVLMKTMAVLDGKSALDIPSCVRELVEHVYDDQVPASSVAGIPTQAFAEARGDLAKRAELERQQAEMRLLGEPDPKGRFASNPRLESVDEDAAELDEWTAAQTRLAEPSVRVVLVDADDPRLAPGGLLHGDGSKLDTAAVLSLLDRSVSISHRPLVNHVSQNLEKPPAFVRCAPLRGYCVLPLRDGGYCFNDRGRGYELVLSDELGVVIGKEGED